jgi:hypothetical protein
MATRLIIQNTYRDNVLSILLNPNVQNAEPFPTFDIEINKEDKDGDIENPSIKKNPEAEKPETEEKSTPDKG